MTKDDAEYVVDTITALRAEVKKLREAGVTMSRAADRFFDSAREQQARAEVAEAENQRLREALENVLSWAEGVAGDTMDMEAREIEIASVERALAVLGKNHE